MKITLHVGACMLMILLGSLFTVLLSTDAVAVAGVSHSFSEIMGLDENDDGVPDLSENANTLYDPTDPIDGLLNYLEIQRPLSEQCTAFQKLVGLDIKGRPLCLNAFSNSTLNNLVFVLGNVGIGNLAPTRTLHVTGDTGINGTVYADAFCIGTSCALSFENLGSDDQTFGEINDGIAVNREFIVGAGAVLKAENGGQINATRVACPDDQFMDGSGDCVDISTQINDAAKFGAYQGVTDDLYQGDLTRGGLIGYASANELCNQKYAGSHFCLEVEILKEIAAGNYAYTGTVWMQKGAPGYTADANDCRGWTTSDPNARGPFWNWDGNDAGYGALTPCSQWKPLACCGGN